MSSFWVKLGSQIFQNAQRGTVYITWDIERLYRSADSDSY